MLSFMVSVMNDDTKSAGDTYPTLRTNENKPTCVTAFSVNCGLFPLVSNDAQSLLVA